MRADLQENVTGEKPPQKAAGVRPLSEEAARQQQGAHVVGTAAEPNADATPDGEGDWPTTPRIKRVGRTMSATSSSNPKAVEARLFSTVCTECKPDPLVKSCKVPRGPHTSSAGGGY